MFLRVASGVAVLTCGLAIGLMTDLGVPGGQALAPITTRGQRRARRR